MARRLTPRTAEVDVVVLVDESRVRQRVRCRLEAASFSWITSTSSSSEASSSKSSLVIEVANSGPSVPLGAARTIFDRSARMGDDGMGLGIGLAIVDAIARAHGGLCALEPSEVGSTFALTLPRYRSDGVGVAEPEAT